MHCYTTYCRASSPPTFRPSLNVHALQRDPAASSKTVLAGCGQATSGPAFPMTSGAACPEAHHASRRRHPAHRCPRHAARAVTHLARPQDRALPRPAHRAHHSKWQRCRGWNAPCAVRGARRAHPSHPPPTTSSRRMDPRGPPSHVGGQRTPVPGAPVGTPSAPRGAHTTRATARDRLGSTRRMCCRRPRSDCSVASHTHSPISSSAGRPASRPGGSARDRAPPRAQPVGRQADPGGHARRGRGAVYRTRTTALAILACGDRKSPRAGAIRAARSSSWTLTTPSDFAPCGRAPARR